MGGWRWVVRGKGYQMAATGDQEARGTDEYGQFETSGKRRWL